MSNFTYDYYRNILIRMKKINKIYSFNSSKKSINNGFMLRHDVDLSLERAYLMANIEKEEEVTATYFILLTSDFYNINSYRIGL